MTADFAKIAPYLSNPFVLVGFFFVVGLLITRAMLKSGVIPPLAKTTGGQVIKLILHYGFVIGLALLALAFMYKYRELELSHSKKSANQLEVTPLDIAKRISLEPQQFHTSYVVNDPLDGTALAVNVSIRYPQVRGHSDQKIERKLNDLIHEWAGANADHKNEAWNHVADYEVISLEYNTLVLALEAGGVYVGAASGTTVNKTLVLNLVNGERFELKDVFRAGYNEHLHQLVKQRAFCDPERTRPADDPGPVRDDQEFFVRNGTLTLVYQRREICAGADGPTFVTVEGAAMKPLLNPNGPLGYLL